MSIERTYFCEAPDCEHHVRTASPPPYLPHGTIETREVDDQGDVAHHFCSWDCLMKYAAEQPVPEVLGDDG